MISKVRNLIKSELGRRMASGAFWSFSGTAIAKFIVLVASIFCARILGQIAYGEYGMVRSTINMFVTVGIAGLGLTAAKYISEFRSYNKERIPSIYLITNGFAFFTATIVTTLILLLAEPIAEYSLNDRSLAPDIQIGGLLLFVAVINGAQGGTLTGFEDFKGIAINTLFGGIAESAGMLIGAYYWGVMGAILGYGLGFIVLYTANFFRIHQHLSSLNLDFSVKSIDKTDLKLLYKFSLPAFLSSMMYVPSIWFVKSLLVKENGFDQLAIYDAADQWRIIILFIPTAVSQIVLPILSGLVKEKEKFWKALYINLFLNGGIATTLFIIICLFGNWIMTLYGKGFDDPQPLIYLSLSTIFSSVASVIGLSIVSRAKMWIGFLFNFLWGVYLIIFSIILLNYDLGAKALALAMLFAYIIHSISQYIYLRSIKN